MKPFFVGRKRTPSPRAVAAVAAGLLLFQAALAGSELWCSVGSDHGEEAEMATGSMGAADHAMHAGMTQAAQEDPSPHHGDADDGSACPMMALCTLASPVSPGPPVQLVTDRVAESAGPAWSVHGGFSTHHTPPPRV